MFLTALVDWFNRLAPWGSPVPAACQAAADACGVADLHRQWRSGPLGAASHLQGRCDPFIVRFEAAGRRSARLVVGGPPGVLPDVTLSLESEVSRGEKGLSSEMEVGDPYFDSQVYVQGPGPVLRAVLDGETRAVVLRVLTDGGVQVHDDRLHVDSVVARGELRAEVSGPAESFPAALKEALACLLDAGRRLATPEDVPARLARNARRDRLETVRVANLMTLDREYPDLPLTRETLHAACQDTSDEVRLHAAVALGAEGRDVLLAMASGKDEDLAARAVEALGAHLPAATAAALMARALRARQTALAQACIFSLGRGGAPESVPKLAEVLDGSQVSSLRVAAARALGRTQRLEAEGPLLRALRHSSEDVRLAAATALADVGTPAAVLPLKDLAERDRGALRAAARTAVAQIQARVTGASPGQVSLAAGEAGQVSLSDNEAGRVSLPDRASGVD